MLIPGLLSSYTTGILKIGMLTLKAKDDILVKHIGRITWLSKPMLFNDMRARIIFCGCS